MSDFAARIGRVRMKAGGADVRVIHNPKAEADGGDVRGSIERAARNIAQMKGDLVGYVTVGIFADGHHSCGFQIDEACPIPQTLMPAYLAEVARRYAISAGEARDVFTEMFEWVE